MSDRVDYYFRQRVTESELNMGFDELEKADQNQAADLGFTGVLANAVVSQHAPVADLTVDVSGPGAALDQLGQRIFFSALQNVNVAQDDNGVSTDVSGAGKEKVVSVFVMFDRALSDPRVDGNSLTVFFRRDESFKFSVVQGAEAPAGTAIPPPLSSSSILLADVTRGFAQTQVLAANISTARRQDAFVLTGSPRSIRRGRTIDAVSDLLSYFNAHVNGTTDRHPAASIDYAGGGNWADGTANPATTVEAQLDKLVSDLAAGGAPKLGATATAGAPNSLVAGTVKSQLDALLGFLNAHINQAAGAHSASAISYDAGPNWADGTTNPTATAKAELDKIISDLSAAGGAPKVGAAATAGAPNSLVAGTVRSQLDALLGFINGHINQATGAHAATAIAYAGGGNWADGTTNPASTVGAQLTKIVSDLTAAAGAARIGAVASGNLPAGTVRSQLDSLDATSVRTNIANVFTAAQTLNGAAGDTNAALQTTSAPTTRKLLWEFAINASYKGRFYSSISYNGAFEITINARWDGTQWVRDATSLFSEKWTFHNYEWRVDVKTGTGNFADSAWDGFFSIAFPSGAPKNISIDSNGELNTTGPLTGYSATEGEWGSTNANIGGGASFASGRLPATASSVTFTVKGSAGTTGSPASYTNDRMGVGWFCGTTGTLPAQRWMYLTFSAT